MRTILSSLSVAVILLFILSSCGNSTKTDAAVYECPMKCEGDKTYDKAGKCPVCGMDLVEVKQK